MKRSDVRSGWRHQKDGARNNIYTGFVARKTDAGFSVSGYIAKRWPKVCALKLHDPLKIPIGVTLQKGKAGDTVTVQLIYPELKP